MSGVNIDMLLLNTSFLSASASDEAKFAEKKIISSCVGRNIKLITKCYNVLHSLALRLFGVKIELFSLNTSFLTASASPREKFAEKNHQNFISFCVERKIWLVVTFIRFFIVQILGF